MTIEVIDLPAPDVSFKTGQAIIDGRADRGPSPQGGDASESVEILEYETSLPGLHLDGLAR